STLSAAGELFAIRTELYSDINPETILDDFEISTQIALKGYSVKYSPYAVTSEKGSENLEEEKKRKIRIAAGGFQTLFRNPLLLNPFKKPALAFKYLSHKVLRWTAVPLAILMIPFINLAILIGNPTIFYATAFILLALFYLFGFIGFMLKNNRFETHLFTIPYYLIMIHIAQLQGLIKYLSKTQNAKWEKVKRET
ncbi:MAG TPA: glycosyltransferase family 2 protein, partial [Tenuifilaceae bacterium]|nr:glycosyltransferase family 2 protein [Tenuifilaceae bacterium]